MPSRSIFSAVAGPTPWNLFTGSASTKDGPLLGVMTAWPFGLLRSLAIFARNLQYEMPAEALRPVTSLMRARMMVAISLAISMPCLFSDTSR